MNSLALLADVTLGGNGMVHNLLVLLVVGIACLLIWWGGKYFIGQLSAPPIAAKLWDGLFVLLALVFAVNFLLSLVGYGFIKI
jgi:hypothetical protein